MHSPDHPFHAALVLEDGRAFTGRALGADVLGEGEVVFNTAMTGYQEVLTDPSYAGQMLCMTYPLQGNYGTRPADAESGRAWARAFIARRRGCHGGRGRTGAVGAYGVKTTFRRPLRQRGCRVGVLPHHAPWADVRATGAGALLLPNGPGDPATLEGPVELCREALGRIPLLGICLGHQVLGRAVGASTSRLPFGHHGANHPVKDLTTGAVHVTSQNHEFQVDAASVPDGDFFISQVNLNDGSVEGLSHRSLPVFSVQYHPEGCPGPTDNQHLFDRFVELARDRMPLVKAVGGGSAGADPPRPRRASHLRPRPARTRAGPRLGPPRTAASQ